MSAQNFTPVICNEDHEILTPGLLMGNTYFQNTIRSSLVNFTYRALFVEPARVAWIGDLSYIKAVKDMFPDKEELLDEFYQTAKRLASDAISQSAILTDIETDKVMNIRRDDYLLNLDKKEYVVQKKMITRMSDVDVLPYLTVVSAPKVLAMDNIPVQPGMGDWAFDTLQLLEYVPEGFTEKKLTND